MTPPTSARNYIQKGPNLGLPRMFMFWHTFISIEIKLHLVSSSVCFLLFARVRIFNTQIFQKHRHPLVCTMSRSIIDLIFWYQQTSRAAENFYKPPLVQRVFTCKNPYLKSEIPKFLVSMISKKSSSAHGVKKSWSPKIPTLSPKIHTPSPKNPTLEFSKFPPEYEFFIFSYSGVRKKKHWW